MSQIETPTGTTDRGPDDAEVAAALEARLMAVWRSRGYRRIEVPTYEDYGLFARLYGGEVRQRLVTFTTDREYALRPDLTAGICRMVAGALDGVPASPMRVASSGRAFRHEWVRPLRQRMFHQMGIERIGDPEGGSEGADLEILSLARLGLVSIGLSGGLLRVGHAGLRRAILEKLVPVGDEQAFGRLSALLDALSRLRDRLNPPRTGADLRIDPEPGQSARVEPADHPDLRPFLGELRRALCRADPDLMLEDGESGLRTLEGRLSAEAASLGLSEAQSEALSRLTWSSAGLDELADVLAPLMDDPRTALDTALGHVESCAEDLSPLVLRFSLGASRWDGFYTGFFFEIDAPVLGPDVAQVLGGGRYDGVMEKLGTPTMPACGFALGLERCAAALALLQGVAAVRRRWNQREPVLVCYTPAAAERAALLGERLGASGASVAFHPEPVAGLDPQVVEGLMALPGTPYRHTLHVGEVTLRLLDVASGSEIPIEEQDLYVLFGTPGAG